MAFKLPEIPSLGTLVTSLVAGITSIVTTVVIPALSALFLVIVEKSTSMVSSFVVFIADALAEFAIFIVSLIPAPAPIVYGDISALIVQFMTKAGFIAAMSIMLVALIVKFLLKVVTLGNY